MFLPVFTLGARGHRAAYVMQYKLFHARCQLLKKIDLSLNAECVLDGMRVNLSILIICDVCRKGQELGDLISLERNYNDT